MQGIELEDVNHIPLAMNEFRALDNAKRKKLRDTKAGQWLRTSAPKVLEAVGDALPVAIAFRLDPFTPLQCLGVG